MQSEREQTLAFLFCFCLFDYLMVSFVYKLLLFFFLFILSYFFIQYFQLNAVNGLDAKPTAMNKTIFKKINYLW